MDTQSSKSLCCALTEANVAETRYVGGVENVLDGVGDIMPCEIVNAEIPECGSIGTRFDGFFGVFVAAVVSQPNIKTCVSLETFIVKGVELTSFHKNKRQGTLRVRQAHPHLTVHEQTVMKVHDRFPSRSPGATLPMPLLRRQSMQS